MSFKPSPFDFSEEDRLRLQEQANNDRQHLLQSIFNAAERYINAGREQGMTTHDKVHGAVYHALGQLSEAVDEIAGAKPHPFNGNLANDYAALRDNDGHDDCGRTVLHLDMALFN